MTDRAYSTTSEDEVVAPARPLSALPTYDQPPNWIEDPDSVVTIDLRSDEALVEIETRPADVAFRLVARHQGLLGASPVERWTKRFIDIAGATTLLIALSPLFAVIAACVRLTSKGPVFYVSERVGKDDRPFRFIKFRSMRIGSDAEKEELAHRNEVTGPVFKIRQDPRTTPVGRWLRRTSLDELPQLVNVILGDMSLVGPRPPTPDEVLTYSMYERQRLLVKPGLTCFWQVRGRSEIDFERWVEMDLDYIENWSLVLDAKLLIETVPAVLSGRGAY